jgi:hypothetical protein
MYRLQVQTVVSSLVHQVPDEFDYVQSRGRHWLVRTILQHIHLFLEPTSIQRR